jgi:hypothetical protein
LVALSAAGATIVGTGTCTQVALTVTLVVAAGVTPALALPLQVRLPNSKRAVKLSVAGAATVSA